MAKQKKAEGEKGLFVSKGALAIARALLAAYPKDAQQIVKTMEEASVNKWTTQKLSRVRLAITFLQGGAA